MYVYGVLYTCTRAHQKRGEKMSKVQHVNGKKYKEKYTSPGCKYFNT